MLSNSKKRATETAAEHERLGNRWDRSLTISTRSGDGIGDAGVGPARYLKITRIEIGGVEIARIKVTGVEIARIKVTGVKVARIEGPATIDQLFQLVQHVAQLAEQVNQRAEHGKRVEQDRILAIGKETVAQPIIVGRIILGLPVIPGPLGGDRGVPAKTDRNRQHHTEQT